MSRSSPCVLHLRVAKRRHLLAMNASTAIATRKILAMKRDEKGLLFPSIDYRIGIGEWLPLLLFINGNTARGTLLRVQVVTSQGSQKRPIDSVVPVRNTYQVPRTQYQVPLYLCHSVTSPKHICRSKVR